MPATLTATAPGKCYECGEAINRGDPFAWGPITRSRVHPDCKAIDLSAVKVPSSIESIAYVPVAREWSAFQQAIFDFGLHGSGNSIVKACPGSGKTTTIEEMCRKIIAQYPTVSIKYVVFAKRNSEEAKQRMPVEIDVSTCHSACNSALMRRLGTRPKVDRNKMRDTLKLLVDQNRVEYDEASAWGQPIIKLVGMAKNEGIGTTLVHDTINAWFDIVDHHDIEFDELEHSNLDPTEQQERAVEIAQLMLAESNRNLNVIDFDDMLYLTIKLGVTLPQFDVVCVDEAQDTNNIQRAILKKMLKPSGRLIAVGDEKQSIYGFRGASHDAMDLIASDFACQTLPLSVNYRCSKAVIAAVQPLYPEIIAHDGAPLGSVETLSDFALSAFREHSRSAILCRNTAPLITLAYKLLSAGIGCTVLGRDIGEGLISLIKKLQGKKALTIETLRNRLADYQDKEIMRLIAKGEDEKAASVDDKVSSLTAAIDALPHDMRTLDGLVKWIHQLFSDDGKGRLTLATIHKAKGLEWPTVFILDRHRMPSKWAARKPWMMVQETNIQIVALTRAQVDLKFVKLEDIK